MELPAYFVDGNKSANAKLNQMIDFMNNLEARIKTVEADRSPQELIVCKDGNTQVIQINAIPYLPQIAP
jgi:hypothetical protein